MARNIQDVAGQAVRRRAPIGQAVGAASGGVGAPVRRPTGQGGPPGKLYGIGEAPPPRALPSRSELDRVAREQGLTTPTVPTGGAGLYTGLSGPRPSVGTAVRRRNPAQPPTAPTGPRVGTPGGLGVHEPGRGGTPPGAAVRETPPPTSPSPRDLGFTPSGDPLADLSQFRNRPPTNEGFLEMMEALKKAYPGRVSDVGASATGVWDKIVIDGITYDAIQAAGGPGARWMPPLSEGPVGSSRGGGFAGGGGGGGGGTVNVGNDPFSQAIMSSFLSLLARPPASAGLADQALAVMGQQRPNQVNPQAQLDTLLKVIQNAPTPQSGTAYPGYEPILDLLTRRQA